MERNIKTERRAFTIVFIALIFLIGLILEPFILPILLATVLTVLFNPLYEKCLKILKNRYLASICVTFLLTLVLLIPATTVGIVVWKQLPDLIDQARTYFSSGAFGEFFQQSKNNLQNWINSQNWLHTLEKTFDFKIDPKQISQFAIDQLKQLKELVLVLPSVVTGTLSLFLQLVLMVVLVFFLLIEGKGLYQQLFSITPLKRSHGEALTREIAGMIYSVFYGSFVTAIVQAGLAGTAFYFLGIPGYLVWALVTFLFSFIPFVGAVSVWAPITVVLLVSGQLKSALFLAIYGFFVISGIDNVLKPLLMKGRTQIHPMLLFLAVMGGLNLVGPAGILLGPIGIAVLIAAFRIYKQDYTP